ncbi:CvpA family protein [Salinisphaera sp.]|uniref:CvpA family protein n=1 Tax=Salinisphaera sp. TaxID=1914330 RepID=UPI000C5A036E|nr:CvpA family protein [Salinisphaera sp.]MBS62828.1 colicin V production CvpA [Salinisphaera sp.]
MIWVDIVILAVVALSAVIGFSRGFLREAVGLATWLLAFYAAFSFAESGAALLQGWISVASARLAVSFGLIFILVLLVGAILNYVIGRLVNQTGFAGTDRAIGGVFGVLRGVAVLIVLVLLAGVTPIPRDAWWQESIFIAHLQEGALRVRDLLPPDLAGAITYPDPAAPAEDSLSSI